MSEKKLDAKSFLDLLELEGNDVLSNMATEILAICRSALFYRDCVEYAKYPDSDFYQKHVDDMLDGKENNKNRYYTCLHKVLKRVIIASSAYKRRVGFPLLLVKLEKTDEGLFRIEDAEQILNEIEEAYIEVTVGSSLRDVRWDILLLSTNATLADAKKTFYKELCK